MGVDIETYTYLAGMMGWGDGVCLGMFFLNSIVPLRYIVPESYTAAAKEYGDTLITDPAERNEWAAMLNLKK